MAIIVIKVGTSSLVNPEKQRLNISNLARIIETVKALTCMGEVLLLPHSPRPAATYAFV